MGNVARMNYIGTSGLSLHARQKAHKSMVNALNTENALAAHIKSYNLPVKDQVAWSMTRLDKFNTVMKRYVFEAIKMEKQQAGSTINKKDEWGRGGVIRVEANRT